MTKKIATKMAAAALVGVLAASALSACSTSGTAAQTKAQKERAAYLDGGKASCGGKSSCKGKSGCKGKSKCGK